MDVNRKAGRYERMTVQLKDLLTKTDDRFARISTVIAVIHGKMKHFFWTGVYTLINGELTVGPYQGSVACQVLEKDKGVCWAGINQGETIIVDDVEKFPGHIACDSRSKSEIVIPLRDRDGFIYGVLDVDSTDLAAFDDVDREWLEKIVSLI